MTDPRVVRRRLLHWFDLNRRDLPWRRDRDPYRIWVSEVMLQQTTVAAVIPYFERFVAAFPTLDALAAADEQDVLRLWQGLGYYRRARHLHAAARQLTASGGMTDDPEAWAALPGVGRYILGAVLSQAFDRALPVVDANVTRVLARLTGETGDVKSSAVLARLWQLAEDLLPRARCGDFNQALMELGQRVCTPRLPLCDLCPVRPQCAGFASGSPERLPVKSAPARVEAVREVAAVIGRAGQVLIARRPPDAARWQNMWEFPQTALNAGETHEQAAIRWSRESLGLTIRLGSEITTVRYAVTRFRLTLTALRANSRGQPQTGWYAASTWAAPDALDQYPMSNAQRKLADAVRAGAAGLF